MGFKVRRLLQKPYNLIQSVGLPNDTYKSHLNYLNGFYIIQDIVRFKFLARYIHNFSRSLPILKAQVKLTISEQKLESIDK